MGPPPDPGPYVYIDYTTTLQHEGPDPRDMDIFLTVNGLSRSKPSSFFHDRLKVTPEVHAAEKVYLVTARYTEQDSNGCVSGNHKFMGVLASSEDAQVLADHLKATSKHNTMEHPWSVLWEVKFNGAFVTEHTLDG